MTSYPSDGIKFNTYLNKEENTRLEVIYEKTIKNTIKFIVKVYRLKIIKNHSYFKNLEITVTMEEEKNKKKHQYSFKFLDLNESFFEYNLKLEGIDVLPLKKEEQFSIFLEALNNLKDCDKEKEKEKMDLCLCTKKQISNKLKEIDEENNVLIDSGFYFSLFLQSCKTQNNDLIHDIILLFNPKNFKDFKNIPKQIVIQLKDEFIKLEEGFKKVKDKENLLQNFFYLLLCFNFYYDEKKALLLFDNNDTLNYLFVNLENFQELFGTLILKNDIIKKLIEMAKSEEQILNILKFAKKYLKDFVDILSENINNIKKK